MTKDDKQSFDSDKPKADSDRRRNDRKHDSLEVLLRKFKRRAKEDGILKEYKDREHYVKPSEKKQQRMRSAQRRTYLQQKADEL